jgi:hypothetical protein
MRALGLCAILAIIDLITSLNNKNSSLVQSVGRNLIGLFSECVYTCPNGVTPSQSQTYVPSANGCGSYNFFFSFKQFNMKGFDDCCFGHDTCYNQCYINKELCDQSFYNCLLNVCSKEEIDKKWGIFKKTGKLYKNIL